MGLKLRFYENLLDSGLDFKVNGPEPQRGAPHIINLSFASLKAETMLHFLENEGLYVSAGSACHAREPEQSHVLKALGPQGAKLSECALRFSFSVLNSAEEVLQAAEITVKAVSELKALF